MGAVSQPRSDDAMRAMVTEAPSSPALAPSDRRGGGKRHQSVLLIGRVLNAAGAPVCLIHDISASGMMARFAEPPSVGETLTVEMRGLPPVAAIVRWVRGAKAGMQFAEPQDVERVFTLRRADGTLARAPRFPLDGRGQLVVAQRRLGVELLDISAGGAKLAAIGKGEAMRGETGSLKLPGVAEALFGTVAWAQGDRFGFRFARPLSLAILAAILEP